MKWGPMEEGKKAVQGADGGMEECISEKVRPKKVVHGFPLETEHIVELVELGRTKLFEKTTVGNGKGERRPDC